MKPIRTKTVGGSHAYSLQIKTIFTLRDFSVALGEYDFHNGINYVDLNEEQALVILEDRYEYFGRNGEYGNRVDLGSDTERYNQCIKNAKQWVLKNYPYLKKYKP